MIKPNNKLIGKLLGRDVYLDINSGRGVHPAQEDSFVAMATDTLTKALDLLDKPAPSSDTNELDRALKTLSQFFFEPTAKPTMAQVWGRAKIDILKWAAAKEQQARINEITGFQQAMFKEQDVYKYSRKRIKELKGGI